MRRSLSLSVPFCLLLLFVVTISSAEDDVNASSTPSWSTIATTEIDNNNNEQDLSSSMDGGFPSLEGMLHWAIGHSDPAKLQVKAQQQHLSEDDILKRQLEIKELVGKLEELPSDTKLMQIAINDLKNASQDHPRALHQLLLLVESLDNANNLHKMGGLSLVIEQLSNSDPEIRTTCAWIVGKASQNNHLVQMQVLELGALPKLMMMVNSSFQEEAIKALYAVSAIVRNNHDGLELFYSEGGDVLIQGILSNATADIRLHRRLVSLVADLAEYQLEYNSNQRLPFLSNCALVRLVIDLTASEDLDLQEKVLLAIKNLLMLKSTELLVLDGFCGLKGALERMSQRLQQLILEENDSDYAIDVEGLCKEVDLIFLEKTRKVSQLPT